MFRDAVFANQPGQDPRVLAQNFLDQARLRKKEPQIALALYGQAKVGFKEIANARQLLPLSEVKSALTQALRADTPEDEALRRRIAEVYFERAELLEKLGNPDKAQVSYKKAKDWGYEEAEPASIPPAAMLAVHGTTMLDRTIWPTSMQGLQRIASLTHEKSAQVDYLFEKALSTLKSLQMTRVSLFLIYAHDNPMHGRAEASTSKYLIQKLSQIPVNLYSDQTPMGQARSSFLEDLKGDGKLEDILTSQLCLLPDQLRDDVQPVEKVVVCCSEVLGSYLKWSHYQDFYRELREAYRHDCKQKGTSAIREVVNKFSQEPEYKAGFYHVLTEMAFLQIRAEQLKDRHGIIPVSLTLQSYDYCLKNFIPPSTVRIEDIPRFEEQAQAGQDVYPNQSRHLVLFKIIERLLVNSDVTKMFLNKFWQGYNDCISRLRNEPSTLDGLEFFKLVDSIFDSIRIEQCVDQTQELAQNRMLHTEIVQKLLPPKLSSIDLREALYRHYQLSNLAIQRISGDQMSLDGCYINLAIVESQAQREKDKKELEKQAATFERLPSSEQQQLEATNPNKLIVLEKLFEAQKLRDGSEGVPKRILIQGRAGIGKTTLCKKLVYEYHQNKLYQDRFESVLWVPLRQLKTRSPKHLEELLCTQYFVGHGKSQAEALSKVFHAHQDKTLFILDGLDEVVEELNEGRPLKDFLQTLLNQAHVVITSRPAGVDTKLLGQLDLELETVGFSPANVQVYIEKFVPASNQAAIVQFIHRMPLIQGLVNIPIQLDALCYSWDRLPQNQEVTMSMLYEAMVDNLWRKDSVRLEKEEEGKVLGTDVIEDLSKSDLEELMTAEIDYLGYLAFKGLETEKIEFSHDELSQRREELNGNAQTGRKLPLNFTTNLKKTSFLHTADVQRPEAERQYNFLHLTFQEFFAAKFLAGHLQAYTKVERARIHVVQKHLGIMPQRNEVEAFIATYKYNPRYEIVWWMVAGLLQGAALENFFNVLHQSPRDLIGMRHQQVMLGCLNEARAQLGATTIAPFEKEVMQWLDFEIKNGQSDYSYLGSQKVFPERLLLESLSQTEGEKKNKLMATLGARPVLSSDAVQVLISSLQDEDEDVRSAAASALGGQATLPAAAFQALVNASQDDNEVVRWTVVNALGGQTMLPPDALQALISASRDGNEVVREAAVNALSSHAMQSKSVLEALIIALRDGDASVRFWAVSVLEGKVLPEVALNALIRAAQDPDLDVKEAAVRVLGSQETLSEAVIQALIGALQDVNAYVRYMAASTLRGPVKLPEAALQTLVSALQHESAPVRSWAAKVLRGQRMLPENILQALLDLLLSSEQSIREAAASVLGEQTTLPEAAIQALAGDLHKVIQPEATHQILISALQDENVSIKSWAASVLGNQKILPEIALYALINALQDPEWDVRDAAASTLGSQTMLPKAALDTLISALQNKHAHIRYAVASALGGHATRSEVVLEALIHALEDENEYVRDAAASALGGKATFSETAIEALISALQDEDEYIRVAAVSALGGQASLSGTVFQALIDALQDDNPSVRSAIMQVLKLNLHQLYNMLPTLDEKQIQTVYKQFLFGYGCAHIAPLYIQDKELHFYTETGLEQAIPLTSEQSTRVIQSFRIAQAEGGIEDIPFVGKLQQDLEQAHSAKADNSSSGEAPSSISDLTYTEIGLEQPILLASEQSTEVIQFFRTARVKVGIEDIPLASKLQQDLEKAHAAKTDDSSSDLPLYYAPSYSAPSETSDQLLKLLKDQPNALIEVVVPTGAGKTTMLQHLIDLPPEFLAVYKLFGRIDCSSVSRAHADIKAISYACSRKDLKPQDALGEVASYIQKNSPSLLILDGLSSGNVDFVLDWLKSSFKSAQLIYLTAESLADSLSEKLERPVKSLSLGLFTPEQAKQLVEKCLPKEPKKSLEKVNFAKVIEMTGGFPATITTLYQHYKSKQVMFKDFDDFLAQPNEYQNALDSSLNAVTQASLKSVEEHDRPVAVRALNIIKQAAWLGDHRIPFEFFVHEQWTDGEAIQMLRDKELAILDINLDSKTLKLNSIFLPAVREHYKVEQSDVLKKNIQRLSEVFNYLTTNEGKNGRQSKPNDLTNYTDLVHTLLFETCKKESFAGDVDLLQQVLALGSSLARMYYIYHGELRLAYDCLQNAQHFVKQGLSEKRIEQFAQNPEEFESLDIEPKEAALLRLYAQEYLYQSATIASQLDGYGQVPAEVVQNFEKSYAIQVNLGEEKDLESIAYTLRNYTRALRKQGHLLNTLEEFRKLRQLLDRYPEVFNERTCAELLIDAGIIQKEAEDAKPEGEHKDYQTALNTLLGTRLIYLKDEAANQHQALGTLSIYLGETYVAAGQFAEGITHTCRILHYDGKNKGRQACAYFNLAQAFDKAGYGALAKLFIERAAPLQLKINKATTDRLQLNIDKKLLERHQQASSSSNAQTASWKTIEELTTYCETELVSGSKPSNNLSLAQIQAFDDKAYNWLLQRDVKEKHAAQQAELDKKEEALDAQEKADAEERATQSRQDKIWYRELANRIKLDELENPLAYAFAKLFEENLRNEIVEQLRVAYGEAVKMGKAEFVGGLVQSLAGLLPEIQVDMTGEVSASIDIATVIQGVAKILTEREQSRQKAGSPRTQDAFSELERAQSMKALASIEEQIKEMANYTARCWQPIFSAHQWSTADIQTLAKQGARRMMEYLEAGKVDKLSPQERVVFALMAGEANKRLTQQKMKGSSRFSPKWSVRGFFTKPGIKVETDQGPMYFLRDTSHPSVYGYRLGSPIEVRNHLHYKGPFTDAKARQEAEKMRDEAHVW